MDTRAGPAHHRRGDETVPGRVLPDRYTPLPDGTWEVDKGWELFGVAPTIVSSPGLHLWTSAVCGPRRALVLRLTGSIYGFFVLAQPSSLFHPISSDTIPSDHPPLAQKALAQDDPSSSSTSAAAAASSTVASTSTRPSPLPRDWDGNTRDSFELPVIIACTVSLAVIVILTIAT